MFNLLPGQMLDYKSTPHKIIICLLSANTMAAMQGWGPWKLASLYSIAQPHASITSQLCYIRDKICTH